MEFLSLRRRRPSWRNVPGSWRRWTRRDGWFRRLKNWFQSRSQSSVAKIFHVKCDFYLTFIYLFSFNSLNLGETFFFRDAQRNCSQVNLQSYLVIFRLRLEFRFWQKQKTVPSLSGNEFACNEFRPWNPAEVSFHRVLEKRFSSSSHLRIPKIFGLTSRTVKDWKKI